LTALERRLGNILGRRVDLLPETSARPHSGRATGLGATAGPDTPVAS
jgi:hypothetical protein